MADFIPMVEVSPRDPTRGKLVIKCSGSSSGECMWPIWQGAAGGTMWYWDGNVEKPTVTPSIHCQACGKHFTVVKGVPVP